MTEIIRVSKFNDVHIKLHCDSGIAYELNEYFTFNVPGAKFSPAFKNKVWDGKIRLFHLMRQTIYSGLLEQVKQFAADRGYEVEYNDLSDFGEDVFPLAAANEHALKCELPFDVRDYQLDAFAHAIRKKRAILLSPTASGKSLIIFLIATFLVAKKVLLIVPNVGLVHQMAADFESYGCPPDIIHKIFSGQEKASERSFIYISTWQSIYKLPKTWFSKFGVVIGDEVHQFKAKSLVGIMENLTACPYRFGFTGTLDGTETNKLVLEGLFGPVKAVTTTSELMEKKTVADLKIKGIVLSYNDEVRKTFARAKPKIDYTTEVQYLTRSKQRNKFLINLASSLKNNTLLLFHYVDHGKMLYQALKDANPERSIFLVYGKVEGEEREEIRRYIEENENVLLLASYKTMSTGTNIPSLENVIFASPSKSRVRVLQSTGRVLRKSETKHNATLYDIADDISWKSFRNHTVKHFSERIEMYNQEKFDYKIYTVKLGENV